jgi:hypothetical protein
MASNGGGWPGAAASLARSSARPSPLLALFRPPPPPPPGLRLICSGRLGIANYVRSTKLKRFEPKSLQAGSWQEPPGKLSRWTQSMLA